MTLRTTLFAAAWIALLGQIAGVLKQWDAAAFEVGLGLMPEEEWPGGGCLCAFYNQIRAYRYSEELGITDAQVQRLDRILQSVSAKDRREPVLAVLDGAQRAKLAAFETQLQLAREAIELGLLPRVGRSECLCP